MLPVSLRRVAPLSSWSASSWSASSWSASSWSVSSWYVSSWSVWLWRGCVGLILLVIASGASTSAQREPPAIIDPNALVRRAVQHRLDADANRRSLRYLLRNRSHGRDTTKVIIETKDGDVARLVAIDGKPLDAQANQAELDRLDTLANHPEIQEHRRKREQEDADRIKRMLGLLPDAFLYRFEDMSPCAGGQCYRLSFSPNPRFDPPNQEAKIFRGMAGEVWIDRAQERLARLDAHLISDVDFGWGIVGRLNEGGTILLEQGDVGGNNWQVTGIKVDLTGRALIVKSLTVHITEEMSHFSTVPPDLDYRKAIQLLENANSP
jgi:hypothetical protein